MTKNHMDLRLLNKSIKLTREMSIIKIKRINKPADSNNVVDHIWNCKKIETINKVTINILFLGSTL